MGADNLLTKSQVAERLSCSERTVERLVANGTLPVVPVGDLPRFRAESVDKFIRSREQFVNHMTTRLNSVPVAPVPAN